MKNILVFKTNILQQEEVSLVKKLLFASGPVLACNVDLDDCDKVLRIESNGIPPSEVIQRITQLGFYCEELTD